MVRVFKRKTDRGAYGSDALRDALQELKNGVPLIRISRQYGIPPRTLRRHRDKKVAEPGTVIMGRHTPILYHDIETELHDHLRRMEKSLYGLTTFDVRRLAFEIAEKSGIKHPFNQKLKMAGKDWLAGFLKRFPDLSVRIPQGTNLSRAVGFNKPKVKQFFEIYKEILSEVQFPPSRIWNMDETGITNVQKPSKIIGTKGARQVGKMISGERGSTVTVICAMSAAGAHLPPMHIFPRMRMVDLLMLGSPPQSVGYASPSGWTDATLFLKWLEHFVNIINSSKESPNLIILDGHQSHKSLDAITYARNHGIHLLTLPPHTTHKLQPLDRTFFKSLKASYNREADSWMVSNPGKRITFYERAGIFGKAFLNCATAEKAVHGFSTCGLWPFNSNIFSDDEFLAAEVTEEPEVLEAPVSTSEKQNADDAAMPNCSQMDTCLPSTSVTCLPSTSSTSSTSTTEIIQAISPLPKAIDKRKRTRKNESSALITSSPYKKSLEEKSTSSKRGGKGKCSLGKSKANSGLQKKKRNKNLSDEESDEDEWPCLICGEPFSNSKSRETWLQCTVCCKWAHKACTAGSPFFVCPNCESDLSD